MFSNEYMQEIRQGFDRQMARIDEEIDRLVKESSEAAVPAGGSALAVQENETAVKWASDESAAVCPSRTVISGGLGALRLPQLQEKKQEILDAIAGCAADETEALQFLYSAMPVSDILEYPAQLFLAYAKSRSGCLPIMCCITA